MDIQGYQYGPYLSEMTVAIPMTHEENDTMVFSRAMLFGSVAVPFLIGTGIVLATEGEPEIGYSIIAGGIGVCVCYTELFLERVFNIKFC